MKSDCVTAMLFLMAISCNLSCLNAQPQLVETMEWKFSRKLYEYTTYGAITLERVDIPIHTMLANITLNAFSTSSSCPTKNVKIFAKQFGIPVVSRDNETFPNNSFIPKDTHNVSMTTNNQTKVWHLQDLQAGSLFIMAIFPNPDTRIRQKGLAEECNYFITIQAKMQHFREESIPILPLNEFFTVNGSTKTIAGFRVPRDTLSYTLEFEGCSHPCPVNVLVLESLDSDFLNSSKSDCKWNKMTCIIEVSPARVNSINYLSLMMTSEKPYVLKTKLQLNICEELSPHFNKSASAISISQKPKYRFVAELSRETPSSENQGSNFYDRFAVVDRKTSRPSKIISIRIPDVFVAVMRMKLWPSDTGSSLNFVIRSPIMEGNQDAVVNLCVSQHRILHPSNCSNRSILILDTRTKKQNEKLIFIYPESGLWYLTLDSVCYSKENNKSSNETVTCTHYPMVNMTVKMDVCLEGKCGKYGSCKLYTSADILYSACDCYSGWRGYGCNDGSRATSDFDQRVAIYLLTFSNVGFFPGIVIALRRRLFVEALVYTYNMFFSTFYHACDNQYAYSLCIMPYNALSFADFFASLLSFAMTLLAMARIPMGLRSFLHMLMALFISLGEVYNRHGLVEQLLPIVIGVGIVVLSWIIECYRRKQLFPSKQRYLKFLLPGLVLASLGLVLNLTLSTENNYKYVHSLWHVLESVSICFLLPPGKQNKVKANAGLSVQSGDVTMPSENIDLLDENGARLRNAGDVSPTVTGSASSLHRPLSLRERIRRFVNPRKPPQNFVL